MNISHTLFDSITKKLKLNIVSSLQEEKFHIKNLLNKKNKLKNLTEKNSKLSIKSQQNYKNSIIYFIINISFLRSNTYVHLSDTNGKTLLFYSAGQVNLTSSLRICATDFIPMFV